MQRLSTQVVSPVITPLNTYSHSYTYTAHTSRQVWPPLRDRTSFQVKVLSAYPLSPPVPPFGDQRSGDTFFTQISKFVPSATDHARFGQNVYWCYVHNMYSCSSPPLYKYITQNARETTFVTILICITL